MPSFDVVSSPDLQEIDNAINNTKREVDSKNGSMIWNYTDKAELTMKNFTEKDLKIYLSKIPDEALFAYNVYQIEGEGRNLFLNIAGDEDTIMGLPVVKIKEYLEGC